MKAHTFGYVTEEHQGQGTWIFYNGKSARLFFTLEGKIIFIIWERNKCVPLSGGRYYLYLWSLFTWKDSLEHRQSGPLLIRHAETHGEFFPKNLDVHSSLGIIAQERLSHIYRATFTYSSLLDTGKYFTFLCFSQLDPASLL